MSKPNTTALAMHDDDWSDDGIHAPFGRPAHRKIDTPTPATGDDPLNFISLDGLTADALLVELGRCRAMTAAWVLRAAEIWRRLVQMGHDLSSVTDPYANALRRVVEGMVSPQMVAGYLGTRMYTYLSKLPLAEQEEVFKTGRPVEFVTVENGNREVRMLPLKDMSADQLRQVIDKDAGRIRSVEEQNALITPAALPKHGGGIVKFGKATVDRKNGIVRIGKSNPCTLADMMEALRRAGVKLD